MKPKPLNILKLITTETYWICTQDGWECSGTSRAKYQLHLSQLRRIGKRIYKSERRETTYKGNMVVEITTETILGE